MVGSFSQTEVHTYMLGMCYNMGMGPVDRTRSCEKASIVGTERTFLLWCKFTVCKEVLAVDSFQKSRYYLGVFFDASSNSQFFY